LVVAIKRAVGSDYHFTQEALLPREKIEANTRKKKQASPLLQTVLGVFLITAIFCGGLSFLYIKAAAAKMNFEMANMKKTNQDITVSNEKLKLEIEKLKSLERVETLAASSLGMIKSSNIEYLVFNDMKKTDAQTGSQAAPASLAAVTEQEGMSGEAQVSSGARFLQRIEMLVFNKI